MGIRIRGGREEAKCPYEGTNRSFIRERVRRVERGVGYSLSSTASNLLSSSFFISYYLSLYDYAQNLYHACISIHPSARWREGSRRERGPAKVTVCTTPTLHPI